MVQVIALLYANESGLTGIRNYESKVIPILKEHHGRLLTASSNSRKSDDEPDEIHVVEFPDLQTLSNYKNDPRVAALSDLRKSSMKDMKLFFTDTFYDYDEAASQA